MAPVEDHENSADSALDSPQPSTEENRPGWRFWRVLLGSIALHGSLTWVLDGIPVRTGEALVLRWLRALAEHPIRGPLGLALAALAVVHLVRAVFNRAARA